mmetsp:Transcript_62408/g.171578  ORF Transcript_62408/g.171578 Transcript_62408/m.171578 type:complete len:431 (-) Transcript_62408:463-1755(-)
MSKHAVHATLVVLAMASCGVEAERPELPEKGLEWADEYVVNQTTYLACSGIGTDSADDELAWPNCVCQGEMDCPALTSCYSRDGKAPIGDGDNVCECHTFFGFEDDGEGGCEQTAMSNVIVIVQIYLAVFTVIITLSYSLATAFQFIKVKAFAFNPAVLTLCFIIVACIFLIALAFMYVNICVGADPDYWQNDNLKGPLVGLFISACISAAVQVLVMWIDVLSKSKSMTGNKKGGLAKLKLGLNVFIVVFLLISIGLCAIGRPATLAMLAFFLLFVLMFIFSIYGNRLAKMIQGDASKAKSSAVVAIEHVAYRMPRAIAVCMVGVVFYVALGKTLAMGAFGLISLEVISFCSAVMLANVLISYVRFGARKKLVKAGYCLPNPLEVASGMTTNTQTLSTQDSDSGGVVASGNQIAPMLKAINKFWAFGFQY